MLRAVEVIRFLNCYRRPDGSKIYRKVSSHPLQLFSWKHQSNDYILIKTFLMAKSSIISKVSTSTEFGLLIEIAG